jgi:group I intron endonuclease
VVIYKITNKINGKAYVGQTVQKPERRWALHCTKNVKISAIGTAIRKYGKENFDFEVLNVCSSIEEMNIKEQYYIELFSSMTPGGYNLVSGGNNKLYSEESKLKMRQARKNQKISEETKNKLSKAITGLERSTETRIKMSESKKGDKHPLFGKTGFNSKRSMAIRCLNDNRVFGSISEAAKFYNINNSNISRVLKQNKPIKGIYFEYYSEERRSVG